MLIGILLNLLPIASNGGRMPVSPVALVEVGAIAENHELEGTRIPWSKSVILSKEKTRLYPLTDIFVISKPKRLIFSIGDVVVAAALMSSVLELWLRSRKARGEISLRKVVESTSAREP